jgi:prepilin-type N-terminal cleavage/methylation domain-containing protein
VFLWRRTHGFTLIELLVVIGILALLIALLAPVLPGMLQTADRAKATGLMRSVGTAIFAKTAENNGRLPGPLWPGQVAEFDKNRNGRLIVELAPFLGIEARDSPHVVQGFLTASVRRSVPAAAPKDIRMYVMNMAVATPNGTINPWGNAADSPPGAPLLLSAIPTSARSSLPMLSEAYQGHPSVAGAPWRSSTPAKPPHGESALELYFDGSVRQTQ